MKGLIEGLIEGCKADIQTPLQSNQDILNSGRTTLLLLAIVVPVAATVVVFLLWGLPLILGRVTNLNEEQVVIIQQVAITVLTIIAMLFLQTWRYGGGEAYLRHYGLRFVLARSGKIPYLYANFLNYCTERLLLQRVGGRFRFLHRTLQEHFAAMPLADYGRDIKP